MLLSYTIYIKSNESEMLDMNVIEFNVLSDYDVENETSTYKNEIQKIVDVVNTNSPVTLKVNEDILTLSKKDDLLSIAYSDDDVYTGDRLFMCHFIFSLLNSDYGLDDEEFNL